SPQVTHSSPSIQKESVSNKEPIIISSPLSLEDSIRNAIFAQMDLLNLIEEKQKIISYYKLDSINKDPNLFAFITKTARAKAIEINPLIIELAPALSNLNTVSEVRRAEEHLYNNRKDLDKTKVRDACVYRMNEIRDAA